MDYEPTSRVTTLRTSAALSIRPVDRQQVDSFSGAIRGHLDELLSSEHFDGASRSRDFLTFIVEEALSSRGDTLNQALIAMRVFGRKGDFDAILDPVVRVQAGRLRRSLERYYLLTGNKSAVRIELPKGSYAPVFVGPDVREGDGEVRVKRMSLSRSVPDWPMVLIRQLETANAADGELAERFKDELAMEISRHGNVRLIHHRDLERLDLQCRASLRFELRGHLRTAGSDAIVHVSLVDRSTGEQVWSDEFHANPDQAQWASRLEDVPLIVAARIASENGVIVRTLAGEHGCDRVETGRSIDAVLNSYHFFLSRQPGVLGPTIESLKKAAAREPETALTWMYLALMYQTNHALELIELSTPIDAAIDYAHQAVMLDPGSARIRCALATCLVIKGELRAAQTELNCALRVCRGSLAYREVLGWLLALAGDWEQGTSLMRDARARNPYCLPQAQQGMWLDAIRRGQFEEAYAVALEYPDRGFFWRDLMTTSSLGLLGRIPEARASAAELLRVKPDFVKRGRILIGHYIKASELRESIHLGCRRAGLLLS